jgi:hypothetical protein
MTSSRQQGASMQMPSQAAQSSLTGWAVFGGIALGVLGVMNFVQGITALQYDELLVSSYVFDDLTFWGWAFMIWGVLQFLGGVMTLAGSRSGPMLGIGLASVAAIGWFFMIFAAPSAALIGIAVSFAIIASLSAAIVTD